VCLSVCLSHSLRSFVYQKGLEQVEEALHCRGRTQTVKQWNVNKTGIPKGTSICLSFSLGRHIQTMAQLPRLLRLVLTPRLHLFRPSVSPSRRLDDSQLERLPSGRFLAQLGVPLRALTVGNKPKRAHKSVHKLGAPNDHLDVRRPILRSQSTRRTEKIRSLVDQIGVQIQSCRSRLDSSKCHLVCNSGANNCN